MDWDSFDVVDAVVHYIPTERDEPEPELLLTDTVIELDDALRRYFRDKLVARISTKGLDVVVDPDRDPCVPDAVRDALANPARLVEISQRVARHLDATQTGVNSSGLLAVLHGRLGATDWLGVVKLERQRGVHFVIREEDGGHVVNLDLLRNLTLTDTTKVFKTALLTVPAGQGGAAVTGSVADDQRGSADGTPVASFFLGAFLGCKPREPAAETTFRFVRAANTAFNTDVPRPETRGRYQVALLATMQSSSTSVHPRSWAQEHLDEPDRKPFLARIEDAGVPPAAAFPKDTSRVRVSQFSMTFQEGMVLVGSPEDLAQRVHIPEDQGPDRPVELHDTVKNVLTGK